MNKCLSIIFYFCSILFDQDHFTKVNSIYYVHIDMLCCRKPISQKTEQFVHGLLL